MGQMPVWKPIEVWYAGVCWYGCINFRNISCITVGKQLSVQLSASNAPEIRVLYWDVLQGVQDDCIVGMEVMVPCNYNVCTVRKRFSHGFIGFSSHDYGVPDGAGFEESHIFRDVKQQFIFVSDVPVLVCDCYQPHGSAPLNRYRDVVYLFVGLVVFDHDVCRFKVIEIRDVRV